MTRKLLCLCAACALFFVFATANVASAEDVEAPAAVTAGCPCGMTACPLQFNPCCAPTYRIGLFGVVRPVVYAPVMRPVYVPQRVVCPVAVPCLRAYPANYGYGGCYGCYAW